MNDIYAALFTYSDVAPMTEEQEAAAIAQAQAGDEDAKLVLLVQYGRLLRNTIPSGLPTETRDDMRQVAVMAVLEAIRDHDGQGARLSVTARQYIRREFESHLGEMRARASVPGRTMSRFDGAMRAAGGDVDKARELAAEASLAPETFDSIHALLNPGSLDTPEVSEALDGELYAPSPVTDVENRAMVDVALRACSDDEHRVVSLKYGFSPVVETVDGERVVVDRLPSDEEIGSILGMTRPTTNRRHKSALSAMRKALHVSGE